MKKGANLMVRHDQQIDNSNFGYFIFENISALFEKCRSKKGAACHPVAKHGKEGVRICSDTLKQRWHL